MFEAYKVGVKISLINHASLGLLGLQRDFMKTEADAAKLEARISSIQKMAMKGGAMLAIGAAGLSLFKAPLDAARAYELSMSRFKTLNLGDAINQQTDKFARSANVLGVSSKDLVDTLRESYGMIGNMGDALKVAPMLASLNAANSTLFGGKIGKIDEGATRSIMRFIDMRGLTNSPEDIKHGLDIAQKMVTGSGGALKFNDLEAFAKRAGTSFKSMSDDGVFMMGTVMQEMGGATAGTGLMSAYQNLVAGRTTKKTMAALQDLGLAKLGYENHGMVGGKPYKTLEVQGIKDEKLLRENFPQWVMSTALPALKAKGITSLPDQAAAMNAILSNRTGSNLGVSFATQFLQTLRDSKMIKNAMGVDQTIATYKADPNSKFADLTAKWNGLLVNLGLVVLPTAIRVLEKLIPLIQKAGDWISKNQGIAKALALSFGALAAAMAIGGTVLLVTAAFRGLGLAMAFNAAGGIAGIANVATKLTGAATGLGALGTAAGVLMAAYIGWKAGGLLNDYIIDPAVQAATGRKDETLGGLIYSKTHIEDINSPRFGQFSMHTAKYDQEQDRINTVSGKSQKMIQVTAQTILDGKKVAETVSRHMAKAVSKPAGGSSSFDFNMAAPPVGLGYTR